MVARCTNSIDICAALGERDPETLLGPLLWLLTRLARGGARCADAQDLKTALVAHATALAAHPAVPIALRLAAGSLAIEHRG